MICRQLAFAACLSVLSSQAAGVYWSDRGTSQLKRMNFDGTGLQTITLSGAVTSAGTNVRGIAMDGVSNRIFWADNGADRILRANTNGSASVVIHTIPAGSSAFPADVRLDLGNQLIYWCDRDRNRIQRATLDGTAMADVITNAAPSGPYFLDLDIAAGKIYWGDFSDGAIYRANLDASGRETLLTGNNQTRGVKADPREGMLYWINRNDKKVHRCPLSAFTNGTITLSHPAVQTIYTNLDTPHGLELDIPARKLYWADTGENAGVGMGDKAVSRGDFDGSTPQEVLAAGNQPWDVDLDRRCANYAEWQMRCFRRDALPAQTLPSADPDGDGIPNSLEYAFDLCPTYPEKAGVPVGLLTSGPVTNSVYHALKFRRRAGTSDLTFQVQSSTDVASGWQGTVAEPTTTEIAVLSLGDGMEEVTVRTLYRVTGYPSHYLRLQVILRP